MQINNVQKSNTYYLTKAGLLQIENEQSNSNKLMCCSGKYFTFMKKTERNLLQKQFN